LPDGDVECWLISPDPAWQDWDEDVERDIHQISRYMLRQHGMPPKWILARMNELLQDRCVYCDGGRWDMHWLSMLIQAAQVNASFKLKDIHELFPGELWLPKKGGGTLYEDLSAEAWSKTAGRRHQADVDVRYLQNLWEIVERL
ncbi:MAG: hypothetical protein GY934_07715, partial [Gammaproteobacteria bacterium]|nr:hypothetical protein [Gammaproteobacteria bacterium]